MLTKIRLSPSGPEIDTSTLLSALLDGGFVKPIPKDSAIAGGVKTTDLPGAFTTTEPGQTVAVMFRFDVAERLPGTPDDIIEIRPRVDGGDFGGIRWQTPMIGLSVAQSYEFLVLLKVTFPGVHSLGFTIDATNAGGQVDLSGDTGMNLDPSALVLGAAP